MRIGLHMRGSVIYMPVLVKRTWKNRTLKVESMISTLREADESAAELYSKGHATKEDYTKALQLQTYLGEIKSDQRDKANYRYY